MVTRMQALLSSRWSTLFVVIVELSVVGCYRDPEVNGDYLQCMTDDNCLPGYKCVPISDEVLLGRCVKPDAQAQEDVPVAPALDAASVEAGEAPSLDGSSAEHGGAIDLPGVDGDDRLDGSATLDSPDDQPISTPADAPPEGPGPDLPVPGDGPSPDQPLPPPDVPTAEVTILGTGGGAGGVTGAGGAATGGTLGAGGTGGSTSTSVVDCGSLTDPVNGSVSFTTTTVGSTATYACTPGFGPSGSASRYCLADGNWSGVAPTCVPANCPGLPSPTHGLVSAPTLTYGSTATYSCESGYDLVGLTQRTCQMDGSWSGAAPTCPPVDCGPPAAPTDGDVSAPITTYTSIATYTCKNGHELSGATTRTCQADRSWSGVLPTCPLVDCGTPEAPEHGHVVAPTTTYGATASFTCDSGYEPSSAAALTCQADKTWTGTPPTCDIVSCPALTAPANGYVDAPVRTYGSVASYSCAPGAILVGSGTRTCQADKTWSGSAPTCQCELCGGSTCVDLQTDRNHCGSCSNVCSISSPSTVECALGRCLATLVPASGTYSPYTVAVDSTHVYWTNYNLGTVTKVPIGGGSVATLANGQSYAQSMVIDSANVYWVNNGNGEVKKVPLGGGTVTTLGTLTATTRYMEGLSLYGSYLYGGNVNNGNGQIYRVALPSGGLSVLATGVGGPWGVAADSSGIYFAEPYNDPGDPSQLKKLPLAGGTLTSLVTAPPGLGPYHLALDSSYAYWTANDGGAGVGKIMKTAKDGSGTTTLVSDLSDPYSIVIDSTTAYWTNLSGTVMKVSLAGGAPTTLATSTRPTWIAVDGTSVYWGDVGLGSGGSIMKVTPK